MRLVTDPVDVGFRSLRRSCRTTSELRRVVEGDPLALQARMLRSSLTWLPV